VSEDELLVVGVHAGVGVQVLVDDQLVVVGVQDVEVVVSDQVLLVVVVALPSLNHQLP